jgi:hypothetical protein
MLSSDLVPSLTGFSIDARRVSKDAFRGIDFRGYLQEAMAVFKEPCQVALSPSQPTCRSASSTVLTEPRVLLPEQLRVSRPIARRFLGFISESRREPRADPLLLRHLAAAITRRSSPASRSSASTSASPSS